METKHEPDNSLLEALSKEYNTPVKVGNITQVENWDESNVFGLMATVSMHDAEHDYTSLVDYQKVKVDEREGLAVAILTIRRGHPYFGVHHKDIQDPEFKRVEQFIVGCGHVMEIDIENEGNDDGERVVDTKDFWSFILRIGYCDDLQGPMISAMQKHYKHDPKVQSQSKQSYMDALKRGNTDYEAKYIAKHLKRVSFCCTYLKLPAIELTRLLVEVQSVNGSQDGVKH